ncbi:MAG: oligosaccharide flippase family protein [Phycisphaerales bacterium]|nr:oligosaccharide flippase family protein [Planctomycetota bacterium]
MSNFSQNAAAASSAPSSVQGAPSDGGYAKKVVKGSFWMVVTTVITRIGSFIAQIFLAMWLSKNDFGLCGVALGLSGIASFLRDGGVRQILLKHHDEHSVLLGPCFWMATAFNVTLALLLTAIAWPSAELYNEPRLAWMLVIIAWSIPLGTPGGILITKLLADMRYRDNAQIQTVSAATRYLSSVAFAFAGFGPFSFVLPNILCALVENIMALRYCSDRPWRSGPNAGIWLDLFNRSKWALLAIIGIAGMNQGPSASIGLAAPFEVVGIYTFTFLIVVQVASLLSTNINQVLVPVFTRLADEPDRKRAAVLRTLRQVSLVATFVSLGLAATYRPFEAAVWGQKWSATILPVQIMGASYAINVLLCISLAVQQARGQFRAWGIGLVLLAIGAMGSTYLGALYGRADLTQATVAAVISPAFVPYLTEQVAMSGIYVAVAAAAFTVTASFLHLVIALKPLGVGRREVVLNAVRVWSLGLVAGALTVWFDHVIAPTARALGASLIAQARFSQIITELFLFGVSGVVFCFCYALLTRFFFAHALEEGLQMVPARYRSLASLLFGLRPATDSTK